MVTDNTAEPPSPQPKEGVELDVVATSDAKTVRTSSFEVRYPPLSWDWDWEDAISGSAMPTEDVPATLTVGEETRKATPTPMNGDDGKNETSPTSPSDKVNAESMGLSPGSGSPNSSASYGNPWHKDEVNYSPSGASPTVASLTASNHTKLHPKPNITLIHAYPPSLPPPTLPSSTAPLSPLSRHHSHIVPEHQYPPLPLASPRDPPTSDWDGHWPTLTLTTPTTPTAPHPQGSPYDHSPSNPGLREERSAPPISTPPPGTYTSWVRDVPSPNLSPQHAEHIEHPASFHLHLPPQESPRQPGPPPPSPTTPMTYRAHYPQAQNQSLSNVHVEVNPYSHTHAQPPARHSLDARRRSAPAFNSHARPLRHRESIVHPHTEEAIAHHGHAPTVPLSEAHLPTYAQPMPTSSPISPERYSALLRGFEGLNIGQVDHTCSSCGASGSVNLPILLQQHQHQQHEEQFGPANEPMQAMGQADPFSGASPIPMQPEGYHLSPPPTFTPSVCPANEPPTFSPIIPATPTFTPTTFTPNFSPSPLTPMLLAPPSSPLSPISPGTPSFPFATPYTPPMPTSPAHHRSASLPQSTTPLMSPWASGPPSPFMAPVVTGLPPASAPPHRTSFSGQLPMIQTNVQSHTTPSSAPLSPYSATPDSPNLHPIPLPLPWTCPACTLSNTTPKCAACGGPAPPWTCTRCTLHNNYTAIECAACHASKPLADDTGAEAGSMNNDPGHIQGVGIGFGARNLSVDTSIHAEPELRHPTPTRRSLVLDSHSEEMSRVTPAFTHGGWMCPVCTYGNPASSEEKCTMCNGVRPRRPLSTAVVCLD